MNESDGMVGKVQALFLSKLHIEVASPETDLFEEGLLDSLRLVDALLHIEQEFGVEVPLEEVDLETFRSIKNIAAYLTSCTAR